MYNQVWLDWFCRQAAKTIPFPKINEDPRQKFAMYVDQGLSQLKNESFDGPRPLEDLWYLTLKTIVAPYRADRCKKIDSVEDNAPNSTVLFLLRKTVNLLSNARPPAGGDQYWRSIFRDDMAIYIDVPHGSLFVDGNTKSRQALQIRAFLLPPVSALIESDGRPFIVVLTELGSEFPRGRLSGLLELDGRVLPLSGPSADFSLAPPYEFDNIEARAREKAADFLRLVLAYYLFTPAVTGQPVATTSTERLRNGKPRKGESLFALTRLQPAADRLGRPVESVRPSWSLTSRQEVSGHFKLQLYGPSLSLKRLIWVSPYERGLEDGPRRPRASRL
jgi:hypothetical protein